MYRMLYLVMLSPSQLYLTIVILTEIPWLLILKCLNFSILMCRIINENDLQINTTVLVPRSQEDARCSDEGKKFMISILKYYLELTR